MAPLAGLLTPSCPGDSGPLLATTDPVEAVERGLALGAVAVTAGTAAVRIGKADLRLTMPGPGGPAGTTAARPVPGDSLDTALSVGVAAAALSPTRHGGTGYLPTLHESQTAGPTIVAVRTAIDAPSPGVWERA